MSIDRLIRDSLANGPLRDLWLPKAIEILKANKLSNAAARKAIGKLLARAFQDEAPCASDDDGPYIKVWDQIIEEVVEAADWNGFADSLIDEAWESLNQ